MGVKSKDLLADISDDIVWWEVQKTLSDVFRRYMCSPEDAREAPNGDFGGCERLGSWNQKFVILVLQELERQGFVKKGTAEEYHRKT